MRIEKTTSREMSQLRPQLTAFEKNAVEYLKNVGGMISTKIFVEDFEPIGEQLKRGLISKNIISESARGYLHLHTK